MNLPMRKMSRDENPVNEESVAEKNVNQEAINGKPTVPEVAQIDSMTEQALFTLTSVNFEELKKRLNDEGRVYYEENKSEISQDVVRTITIWNKDRETDEQPNYVVTETPITNWNGCRESLIKNFQEQAQVNTEDEKPNKTPIMNCVNLYSSLKNNFVQKSSAIPADTQGSALVPTEQPTKKTTKKKVKHRLWDLPIWEFVRAKYSGDDEVEEEAKYIKAIVDSVPWHAVED